MRDSSYQVQTPVAIIFFNRARPLKSVMKRVREVRPRKLFLIADGPRAHVPGDAERCDDARAVAEESIDWECDIQRCYAEHNLGCGPRPATGISWVFRQVEEAIILEDDCVPEVSFFRFCDEMLERYRDNEDIFQVCGTNYFPLMDRSFYSYHFSRYLVCWGWATWRRAWNHFDYGMRDYDTETVTAMLEQTFEHKSSVAYWGRQFERLRAGDDSVWDLRWLYAGWRHQALGIIPRDNLVSNIGFGTDSTHTRGHAEGGFQPTQALDFPLAHPPVVARSHVWDAATEEYHFKKPTLWQHAKGAIKRHLPNRFVAYVRENVTDRPSFQLNRQAS